MKSDNALLTGIFLAVILCIGKVFAFIRQVLVSYLFGASSETDVYFLADNIVSLFSTMLVMGFSVALLTYYTQKKAGGIDTTSYIKTWMTNSLFITAVVTITLCILSPLLSMIFVGKVSNEMDQLMISMICLLSISIIPISLSSMWGTFLEGEKCFYPTQMQGIICSSVTILILFLTYQTGIFSLATSFILGYVAHFMYIVYMLRKKKLVQFAKHINFSGENRDILKMVVPAMFSSVVINFNHIVDKFLAAQAGANGVSILYYAQVGSIDLISSIFILSVNALLITKFTTYVASNDIANSRYLMWRSTALMTMISAIVTILFFVCSYDIVLFIFGHSKIDEADLNVMSDVIKIYSISLIFIPIREIAIRAHYSFKDTKRPLINSIIGVVFNLVLSIILYYILGIYGIAIATSASFVLTTILSYYTIRKHIQRIEVNYASIAKILLASCVALMACVQIHNFVESFYMRLIAESIVPTLFFILVLYVTRMSEYLYLYDNLMKILKIRK